ncbi:MAG: MBL fold metallo-hydrolase, partial [Syntrophales bacterium]
VGEIGYGPEDIDYLIFSHTHIDHAGAAGSLCRRLPRLHAMAHERGVPHLADPTKLVESMKRVFWENAEQWHGAVEAVLGAQLETLTDGDVIDLGRGVRLRVVYTPGHAVHHLSLFEEGSRTLLAGEALGVYFPEAEVYFPSTPPPEFDLVQAVKSIEKLAALNPAQILYTHFGLVPDAETAFQTSREVLIDWGRIVHRAMQEQNDIAYISEKLSESALKSIAHLADDSELYSRYKALVEYRSRYTCGPGYVRYFKQGGTVL